MSQFHKDMASFHSCSEDLSDMELESNALICLVEKTLRKDSLQAVSWLLLTVLIQVWALCVCGGGNRVKRWKMYSLVKKEAWKSSCDCWDTGSIGKNIVLCIGMVETCSKGKAPPIQSSKLWKYKFIWTKRALKAHHWSVPCSKYATWERVFSDSATKANKGHWRYKRS